MKLRVISDLHLNCLDGQWFPSELPDDKDTILIICGDEWESTKIFLWAENQPKEIRWMDIISKRFKSIIFIAGNHTAYDENLYKLHNKMLDASAHLNNVFFLQNDHVILDNVFFCGCILWTDFNKHNPLSMLDWSSTMNDAKYIKGLNYSKIGVENIYIEHLKSVSYLKEALSSSVARNCREQVVITHHAPSRLSLDPRYKNNNEYYYSDLEWMIEQYQPKLWLHGHLHSSSDYMIDDTRIICNPKGYETPGWVEQTGFNDKLIVEI